MSSLTDWWVCGHKRKCGWAGRHGELVYKPDPMWSKSLATKVTRSHCPKCDGVSFYVRTKELEPEAVSIAGL